MNDKTTSGNALFASLIEIFLIPAFFLWTMPGLASAFPALSPLCTFGYWQWVGTLIVVRKTTHILGNIFHK